LAGQAVRQRQHRAQHAVERRPRQVDTSVGLALHLLGDRSQSRGEVRDEREVAVPVVAGGERELAEHQVGGDGHVGQSVRRHSGRHPVVPMVGEHPLRDRREVSEGVVVRSGRGGAGRDANLVEQGLGAMGLPRRFGGSMIWQGLDGKTGPQPQVPLLVQLP
jgi:hypothetical protein